MKGHLYSFSLNKQQLVNSDFIYPASLNITLLRKFRIFVIIKSFYCQLTW